VIRGRLPGQPVDLDCTSRPTPWNRRSAWTQDRTSRGRAPRRTFGSSGTSRVHEVMPCRRRRRRPLSATTPPAESATPTAAPRPAAPGVVRSLPGGRTAAPDRRASTYWERRRLSRPTSPTTTARAVRSTPWSGWAAWTPWSARPAWWTPSTVVDRAGYGRGRQGDEDLHDTPRFGQRGAAPRSGPRPTPRGWRRIGNAPTAAGRREQRGHLMLGAGQPTAARRSTGAAVAPAR
jgi:hypothetical protein